MKLQQSTTSTQPLTSDTLMFAVMYMQPDGMALWAFAPKPPTPEAVAKAQFVDKTYRWAGK